MTEYNATREARLHYLGLTEEQIVEVFMIFGAPVMRTVEDPNGGAHSEPVALSAPPEGELRCRICGMVGTYQAAPEIDFKQRGGMNPASPAPLAPMEIDLMAALLASKPVPRAPDADGDQRERIRARLGLRVVDAVSSPPRAPEGLRDAQASISLLRRALDWIPLGSAMWLEVEAFVRHDRVAELLNTSLASEPAPPEGT